MDNDSLLTLLSNFRDEKETDEQLKDIINFILENSYKLMPQQFPTLESKFSMNVDQINSKP